MVKYGGNKTINYKYRRKKFMKHKFLITGLATATILSAVAVNQLSPSVYASETTTTAPKTKVEKAKEAEKVANAKLDEAKANLDKATKAAKAADAKLVTEKQEAEEANNVKSEAEKNKKTADDELAAAKTKAAEADAKATEETKKEEDAKKEEADSKDALSKALDKLEEAIANDSNIANKEAAKKAAKELVGKEELLKAIESGEITAKDLLAEFADDNEKSEKNEAVENKLRNKKLAEKVEAEEAGAKVQEASEKNNLPKEIREGIDKAEKADAARPESEKLQDKADDLGEEVDTLEEETEKLKAEEDKKAEALKKQEDTLKETKEALKSATENGSEQDILDSLNKATKGIEKARDAAQNAFDEAAANTQASAVELNKLTDEYNKVLNEVKVAKEKEAKEPAKPVEEAPAKPVEKTEAEKAIEAKKEADAKVDELQKKADEAKNKSDEATAKAKKESDDVTSAQNEKDTADKAKKVAEDDLVKAEEEATKAKTAVEEAAREEFLANFDESVKDTIKELEDKAKDNPEIKDQIQGFIDEFKNRTNKTKEDFVRRFKDDGLTAEEAEKEVELVAKAEEEAEAREAKEEADAQTAFLEKFDKALADTIAALEKAETQGDKELEAKKLETIKALKEEAGETRNKIVEGFKNGLTAEDAEKALDEANKKFAEEAAEKEAARKEEADTKEALKGALEKLEKEAEDRINNDSRIKAEDKAKAIEEAKAVIGKDALLKAIEDGEIKATEAAKELENQFNTAEANKNQDPTSDEIGATKQDGKPLSELPDEDKKELDEAYNKEASKPIVAKLTDIADDLAEKIEKLAKVAEKDKADATTKTDNFAKQNETLEKVKAAVETAKKNSSNQAVLDALQLVESKLEADTKEAKAKFDEVNESLQARTEEINKLTDEYNETLENIKNLKETPTSEKSEYTGGVSDDEAPTVETPEYNGGVTDNEAPVEPTKPEAPKPAEKSEVDKKIDALKEEIKALETELAKDKDNEEISDKLNAMRSALARAEKDLKENPNALIYAVLLPKVNKTKLSEELTAQLKKLEEEAKTADETKKADLAEKIKNLKALILDVKAQEEEGEKREEFLDNFDKALEETVKKLEKAETNGDAELEKQKQDIIKKLKEEAAAKKADFVKRFEEEGLTAKEAEKELDEANEKAEEAAKEKAAQEEFLENYDAALKAAVAELEKAETNSPEEAKAKTDTIAALKAASDETRKQIVEGFKKGLTAKKAEAFIDELNKKAAEEDKEEANKPGEQPKVESSNGDALVQPVLPEFGANNPEIKKILDEIAKVKEQLKDAEENEGVEDYYKEGLSERLKDLEEAFDTLSQNRPAVNEVPEFDLSKLNKYPTPNPEPTPGTPAPKEEQKAPSTNNLAGINPRTSANSAQTATEEKPAVALAVAEAPKAQENKKQELPNTGSAEFAVFTPAVLSILAGLGLVLPKGKKEDK